ncbi:acyl--CoA ligase family protein [Streptomyces sp. NPDC051572]|uniref:acyl--CoA ligase family protein n=1 Tax=unclassified Streptomyces TaxID=2593676 RepID=UPI00344E91AA
MADFTFSPLTPTAFLDRAASVFASRPAIVEGELRFTYAQFADRSRRLAGGLRSLDVRPGDRVAALCVNSHVMLEMHNGVPYAGAVLVTLNIRLSVEELVYVVGHSGAKVLVATADLAERAQAVAAATGVRLVVHSGPEGEYERLLAAADPFRLDCADERDLLAVSYTSGTTGRPKGVAYHHRGAYLQTLAMAYHSQLTAGSRYLWTLPQFHCNGWCFTWAVTAAGGTHVCLPTVDPAQIWRLIRTEGVTHFSAAPTVLTMIANAPEASGELPANSIHVGTGGAPPSPTLLARMAALRMDVTHLYGLTETFGPVGINQWNPEWDDLPGDEQAQLKARQGVGNVIAERLRVVDGSGADVPADGLTVGRLVCRGNDVMLGYYRDDEATEAVTIDGWLLTGDLGVLHPDGYVEIRDREKDIIISGGENIASVEIERVLDAHPAVLESAVIGRPDDLWGEVPVAFVALRPGAAVSAQELVDHARRKLARFKAPKEIVFGELPKTSTGKIQKNALRANARRQR